MDDIFRCVSKFRDDDDEQNVKMAHVIETEIIKWLQMLVNGVNMFASNAADYFKVLLNQLSPEELSTKYRSMVGGLVSY